MVDQLVPFVDGWPGPEGTGQQLSVRSDRNRPQAHIPMLARFFRYNQRFGGRASTIQKAAADGELAQQTREQGRLAGLPLTGEERQVAACEVAVPEPRSRWLVFGNGIGLIQRN